MEDFSDQSKLFVGGISWETSEETLTEHFSRYGAVVGCVIARDRLSGNPRGFAFVSFSDPAAVELALQDSHDILGRTVCLLSNSFFLFFFVCCLFIAGVSFL